jgi:hypothetical protein
VRPAITVLLSVCASLALVQVSAAGDKIKIEIVEATTTIQTLSTGQMHFMFDAKVILPDGSHAALICLFGDNGCAGIAPIIPEKSAPPDCTTSGAISTCVGRNLGFYDAKRNKNQLVIYGSRGKLRYHIVSSW